MWDRLTTPTPTVTPESTFRQPIRRFTVSRPPPFRLSFHLCFRVVPVVCVFVPCGILRGSCPSEWSRERSAPSSVARVCRLTPPYTRTTLCRLSLLHHRRRWVSLMSECGSLVRRVARGCETRYDKLFDSSNAGHSSTFSLGRAAACAPKRKRSPAAAPGGGRPGVGGRRPARGPPARPHIIAIAMAFQPRSG